MQECPNSKTAYMYPNDYSCAYILGTKKKKRAIREDSNISQNGRKYRCGLLGTCDYFLTVQLQHKITNRTTDNKIYLICV